MLGVKEYIVENNSIFIVSICTVLAHAEQDYRSPTVDYINVKSNWNTFHEANIERPNR